MRSLFCADRPVSLISDVTQIGYIPFGRTWVDLFFNAVVRRYERTSIIVTSTLPSQLVHLMCQREVGTTIFFLGSRIGNIHSGSSN